jgi:hypothetical protein
LIDACLALSPTRLGTAVPGTYGSIVKTLRRVVDADGSYLYTMTDDRAHLVDAERMGLPELRRRGTGRRGRVG